jgi:hypothetical protein
MLHKNKISYILIYKGMLMALEVFSYCGNSGFEFWNGGSVLFCFLYSSKQQVQYTDYEVVPPDTFQDSSQTT